MRIGVFDSGIGGLTVLKKIMILRYGLFGHKELTQKEVADLLGISQSYISRIEKKVIGRLKIQNM